jgi:beta-galactosidase beta subunit
LATCGQSGGQFALKVETLFATIADQYTRSASEAAAAVHAMYAPVPGVDGMLM